MESKIECITRMASLINIGKHKRMIRIDNKASRKGNTILTMMVTWEILCISFLFFSGGGESLMKICESTQRQEYVEKSRVDIILSHVRRWGEEKGKRKRETRCSSQKAQKRVEEKD